MINDTTRGRNQTLLLLRTLKLELFKQDYIKLLILKCSKYPMKVAVSTAEITKSM